MLLFLSVGVTVFARSWAHPATTVPGFPDDNKSFLWGLEWFAWSITHGVNPFVTTYVHAPIGINVLWNAWSPLLAIALTPVTLIFGPMAAYSVYVTGAFALSGCAAWRAATRFVGPSASVVVGIAYELSPYMLGHGPEDPMLVFAVLPPLVLLLVTDVVRGARGTRRTGVLLGLAVAGQAWVDEEVVTDVALTATLGAIVAVVLLRRRIRPYVRPLVRTMATAVAVAIPLLAPIVAIQFFGPHRLTALVHPADFANTVDLSEVLRPPMTTLLGRNSSVSLYLSVEATAYLGFLPIAALVGLVSRPRNTWTALLTGTAVATAVLSTGTYLRLNGSMLFYPMPWSAVSKLPLLGQLQPNRLTLEVFLLVALVAARGIEVTVQRKRAVGAALAVVTVGSLLPAVPLTLTTRPAIPRFFSDGATELPRGCLAAVAPVAYDGSNDDAMVWQAAAHFRFRMMGGYVLAPLVPGQGDSYSPQPYAITSYLVRHGQQDSRYVKKPSDAEVLAETRNLHLCAVVVGYPNEHAQLVDDLTGLLGRQPTLTGDVALWQLPG